jgi:hypothetical protein
MVSFFLCCMTSFLAPRVVEETEEGLATIDQTDIRGLDTAAQWSRRQLASLSGLGSVSELTSDS